MDRDTNTNAGISLAESVLLRSFGAPEKVLGTHYKLWMAFALHIDRLRKEDWERVAAAWTTARAAAWDAARAAARAAAGDAAGDAARDAARAAAWAAAGADAAAAAAAAAGELVGWSKLEEPFFLKMFFDDPEAWVKSIEDEDD